MDSNKSKQEYADFRAEIRRLIGSNKIKEAVRKLIDWAARHRSNPDADIFLLLCARYNDLEFKLMLGTEDKQKLGEEKNKVILGILSFLDKIGG